jgi:hypothetical protein
VRATVERAEQAQRLRDGELVGELGLLQLNPEPFSQRTTCRTVAPRHAQDVDLAAVGWGETFQDFDRGGLAGAVRAEQAEAFTGGDGQVEPGDGDNAAEALGETAAADGGRGGQEGFCSGFSICDAALSDWSS